MPLREINGVMGHCLLNHSENMQTGCVSTDIGLICGTHMPDYLSAIATARQLLQERLGNLDISAKQLRKKVREILLGDKG